MSARIAHLLALVMAVAVVVLAGMPAVEAARLAIAAAAGEETTGAGAAARDLAGLAIA